MGLFSDLLKEYPALAVARERIALAEEKFAALEKQNLQLVEENGRLRAEIEKLQKQIPSSDFVESHGVLFKRKTNGQFEPLAYCPDCRRVLSALEDFMPLNCSKCGFRAALSTGNIASILMELQG